MSEELATLLSGRYVELKMLPLFFKEYVSAFDGAISKEELYRNYVYNSSVPYTVELKTRRNVHAHRDGIVDSLPTYRDSRYDIKGKEYLQLQDKYYLVDTA